MLRLPISALLLLILFSSACRNENTESITTDSLASGLFLMPERNTSTSLTRLASHSANHLPTTHRKNQQDETQQSATVGALLAPLHVSWQHVTLAAIEGPQVLTFAKGTRITFERKDFVRLDGKPIMGSIEVRLKEFYSKQEMLVHKLNTRTHKGELLESGGMLQLEAFSEGATLEIAKGQEVQIEFPTLIQQEDMQVFYALLPSEDEPIEWIPGNNATSPTSETKRFHQYSYSHLKDTKEEFLFLSRRNTLNLESNLNDVVFAGVVSDVERSYTNKDSILKYDGLLLSPLLGESPSGFFKAEFELNAFGKLKEDKSFVLTGPLKGATIDLRPLQTKRDNDKQNWEVIIAPKGTPSSTLRFTITLPKDVKKKVVLNVEYFVKQDVWNTIEYYLKQQQLRKAKESIRSSDVAKTSYYLLRSSRLGLINCDRFYTMPEEQKTDVLVLNTEQQTEYHLVFAEANSVLSAGRLNNRVQFANMPKGAKAYIIALKCEEAKLSMAILPITIGLGPVLQEDLRFAEVSPEGFQKAISGLVEGNL
jgi:hypothetical protein